MTQQFRPLSVRDVLAALSALQETVFRQADEATERLNQSMKLAGFGSFTPAAVSASKSDDSVKLTLKVALPGFNKSDIKVEMGERAVTVSALHGENHPLGLTGNVELTYPLPFPVDAPNTSCELKDGVLTLVLPSAQALAKSVQVPVR